MSELARASACELLAGFEARVFTPAEALEAVARRIEAVEPRLNARASNPASSSHADARASSLTRRS